MKCLDIYFFLILYIQHNLRFDTLDTAGKFNKKTQTKLVLIEFR